jgi:uncharacterized protein
VAVILRAADRRAVSWKNGGGLTREVAVHPPGSGFGGFDWRVSMAEVRIRGPFSSFPGVDRCLAVLEGELSLAIAGRDALTLCSGTPPIHFPGEAAVVAEPLGGPVTDLNVMTRRGRCATRMSRTAVNGSATLRLPQGSALVVAVAPLALGHGAGAEELAKLDAALLEGPCECEVRSAGSDSAVWLIELMTRTRLPPSHLDQSR